MNMENTGLASLSKLLTHYKENVAYTARVAAAATRFTETPNAVSVDLFFENGDCINKITFPASHVGGMVAYWQSICDLQADLIRTNTTHYLLARQITNDDRDAVLGALPQRETGTAPNVIFSPGSVTVKADIPVNVRPIIDMGGDKVIEYDRNNKPIAIRRAG